MSNNKPRAAVSLERNGGSVEPSANRGVTRDGPGRSARSLRLTHGGRERRHHLEDISDDSVVGNLENGCLAVLVDRDDRLRRTHAGEVLNGAVDANGNVQVRAHLPTSLSDLIAV